MTVALGKISFSDTPDVNGASVLTTTSLPTELTNLVVPGTEGITLPNGTTAQRPASPQTGETRFNTTTNLPEIYAQGTWLQYARVIQTVAGQITSKAATAVPMKTTTTVPLITEGTDIWTQSFTPLVAGSTIVVQYTFSGYLTVAAKALFTAAFAGNTCIGMTTTYAAVVGADRGIGTYNLTMQCVYTSVSTAAISFSARAGGLTTNTAGNTTVGVNTIVTAGNYGNALQTEYRILEMI